MSKRTDLLALILYLKAEESGNLPATHGHLVHGAFISLVKDFLPELIVEIHNRQQNYRPFTISSLYGPSFKDNLITSTLNSGFPSFIILAGEEYCLRITTLNKKLTEIIQKMFKSSIKIIRIGKITFEIIGISFKNHKRADMKNYLEIYEECTNNDFKPSLIMTLNFLSPTSISSHGVNQLFPLPSLIFPKLISRWNYFSPIKIDPLDAKDFENNLMVSGYNLKTHMLDFGKEGRKIGFSGFCQYTATKDANIEVIKISHLLGRFSFFSGIGYGTPRGMGQVEFIPQLPLQV